MIYFITIHWKIKSWIYTQLEYIHNYTPEPYRIYCLSTGIDFRDYSDKFFFIQDTEVESHVCKINFLAKKICAVGNNDDLLIFIDGDAFPIAHYLPFIKKKIEKHKLIAIRRDENRGDNFPHPSFCATTIKFWKDIKGTWAYHKIKNSQGFLVNDAGTKLLLILQKNNINWYPMLRTNEKNLHPVFYGIYEKIIYHHVAGYRKPFVRDDFRRIGLDKKNLIRIYRRILLILLGSKFVSYNKSKLTSTIKKLVSTLNRTIVRKIVLMLKSTRYIKDRNAIELENEKISKKIINKIQNNDKFYEIFMN